MLLDLDMIGEVTQEGSSRTYFRYGLVHDENGGEADLAWNLFNCMRYDSCFLVRQADVEVIGGYLLQQNDMGTIVALIGKYCFTKSQWPFDHHVWPGSHYQIEEINDAHLYELGKASSLITSARKPIKPLTHRSVLKFKGTVDDVLRIMYTNCAFPNRETDANEINHALYNPGVVMEVELATFIPKPKLGTHKWKRPSCEIVMM